MKKKMEVFLKQGLAVMMSLSLAFGPCTPGIRSVFGAQTEVAEIDKAEEEGMISDGVAAEAEEISDAEDTEEAVSENEDGGETGESVQDGVAGGDDEETAQDDAVSEGDGKAVEDDTSDGDADKSTSDDEAGDSAGERIQEDETADDTGENIQNDVQDAETGEDKTEEELSGNGSESDEEAKTSEDQEVLGESGGQEDKEENKEYGQAEQEDAGDVGSSVDDAETSIIDENSRKNSDTEESAAEEETELKDAEPDEKVQSELEAESGTAAEKLVLQEDADGTVISLSYDQGVFPDNVTLEVRKVEEDSEEVEEINKDILTVLNKNSDYWSYSAVNTEVFDIKVLDEEGVEVQPDLESGRVYVTFSEISRPLDAEGDVLQQGELCVLHLQDNSKEKVELLKAEEDFLPPPETESSIPRNGTVINDLQDNEDPSDYDRHEAVSSDNVINETVSITVKPRHFSTYALIWKIGGQLEDDAEVKINEGFGYPVRELLCRRNILKGSALDTHSFDGEDEFGFGDTVVSAEIIEGGDIIEIDENIWSVIPKKSGVAVIAAAYQTINNGVVTTWQTPIQIRVTHISEDISSGKCGDNIYWSINGTELTITGTGAIYDYNDSETGGERAPWTAYLYKITTVNIEAGITRIGNRAFQNLHNLTSLNLPDTLEEIGQFAFAYSDNLTELVLSESLVKIGSKAFLGCNELGAFSIPESVTNIGTGAFAKTEMLSTGKRNTITNNSAIQLIGGVSDSIGHYNYNYSYCPTGKRRNYSDKTAPVVEMLTVTGTSENDAEIMVTAHDDSDNGIALYAYVTDGSEVPDKERVYLDGNGIFVVGLTAEDIDKDLVSVTKTEDGYQYTMISSVRLMEESYKYSTTRLEANTFYKFYLVAVDFTGNVSEVIGGSFKSEPRDNNVIDSGKCGDNLTWNVTENNGLFTLTISGTGEMWSRYGNRDDLKAWDSYKDKKCNLSIGHGITSIGDAAFQGFTNINDELVLPSTLRVINANAFDGCTGLKGHLILPSGLEEIGDHAFAECTNLESLSLPDSITRIGEYAFYCCRGLKGTLLLPSNLTFISEGAFCYSGFSGIILPAHLNSIHPLAFAYCTNLSDSIIFPETLKRIGIRSFDGCSSLKGDLLLPDSIEYIGTYAFRNCSGLDGKLHISQTIQSLDEGVFYGCSGLTGELTIPNSVKTIESYAFYGCDGFNGSLTLDEALTSIGRSAFEGCNYLTGVVKIPNEISTLPADVFKDCSHLDGIIFLSNTINYTETTFKGTALKYMVFSGSTPIQGGKALCDIVYYRDNVDGWTLEYLNQFAPHSKWVAYSEGSTPWESLEIEIQGKCGNDLSFKIGRVDDYYTLSIFGNGEMDDYSYYLKPYWRNYNDVIRKLIISNGITKISDFAFSDLSNVIGNLQIPSSVTNIGNYAFSKCSGFSGSLIIPDTVEQVGGFAFESCNGFDGDLYISKNLTRIENGTFFGCSNVSGILKLPYSLSYIGAWAFYSCEKIGGDLEIPKGVTEIGEHAFESCESLTGSIIIPEGITEIKNGSFGYCNGIDGIISVPEGVTSIGSMALYLHANQEQLVIPESVRFLGEYSLPSGLQSIVFKGDAPVIEMEEESGYKYKTSLEYISYGLDAVYYPDWKSGWTEEYRNDLGPSVNWVPYSKEEPGTEGNIPYPEVKFSTNPKLSYGISEYNLITTIVPDEYTVGKTYNNLVVEILLPAGMSFSKDDSLDMERALNFETLVLQEGETREQQFPIYITNYKPSFDIQYWIKADGGVKSSQVVRLEIDTPVETYYSIWYNDEEAKFNHPLDYYVTNADSTTYNPNLALMLVALSSSAYDENNIKKSLSNMGFEIPNNEKYFYYYDADDWNTEDISSVAYSISKKTAPDGTVIVPVILRGSSGTILNITGDSIIKAYKGLIKNWYGEYLGMSVDWAGNFFNFRNEDGPHSDFNQAADKVYTALEEYLSELDDGTNVKIVVTGHSRAAAVGNLLANKLNQAGYPQESVYAYNFACPDSAREKPSKWNPGSKNDNIFNICNIKDPVGQIPGDVFTFCSDPLTGVPFQYGDKHTYWGKYGQTFYFSEDWNTFEQTWLDPNYHNSEVYVNIMKTVQEEDSFKTRLDAAKTLFNLHINAGSPISGTLLVIFCPVDVTVINSKGEEIVKIENGEPSAPEEYADEVFVNIVNDEKQIFISGEDSYSVKLTGTDAGTMDYGVYQIGSGQFYCTQKKEYCDVQLFDGKQMISEVDQEKSFESVPLYVVDENNNAVSVIAEDGAETPVDSIPVAKIKLDPNELNLEAGKTCKLSAIISPAYATDKSVSWNSSNNEIATVAADGTVKAVKPGTAIITATTEDGGKTASCEVTVKAKVYPVTGVALDQTSVTATEGDSFTLAVTIAPENATNKNVSWSSSDAAVASVDNNGKVTALKAGTATIAVTTEDGGKTASCEVTIKIPVTSLVINTGAKTMLAGKTFQLAAWPQPVDATDRSMTWSSSNPAVATVSSTGLVTAVKNGTANITVKTVDGGFTKTCAITVGIPVTSVKINVEAKTIIAGKTFKLAAWPQPANASNRTVTWSSSNPAVATVDSTGLVTAVQNGKATIKAVAVDGGISKTCSITVGIPVTSIKINTTAKIMYVGRTFQLAAWPQPANAANRAVIWMSSNPEVATISASGVVKAVKAGTTTITAKTVDGGFTQTCKLTAGLPVTGVKINTTAKTIAVGKTFQLAAWPQPSTAGDKSVSWSSSNTSLVTVSSTGLVKGIKPGIATITVTTTDGGKTAGCKITVNPVSVTGVKLNTTARTITAGKTFQLAAWPQPSTATNKTVTWTSSNTSVATVSSTGLVKAVKEGTATITVKTVDGGYTATCRITVKAAIVAVTGVKINTTAKTMNAGTTFQLAAWPQPSTATNKTVTWTSSNTSVATVSSTGLVKAVKKGTATITVKTSDGGYTERCKITVK